MNKRLLKEYIKLLAEVGLARVPNQLVSPDAEREQSNKQDSEEDLDDGQEEGQEITEFSGVGAIAGFTGPLGASADSLGRDKERTPKKKKH